MTIRWYFDFISPFSYLHWQKVKALPENVTPVPIVFGKNPARVSMDASGDRVVVAFEDPNANQPAIGISLSKTMGHLFEHRSQATSFNVRARQPVVRLDGDSIHLWWSEYSANPAVSATRAAYRSGYIQPR